MTERPASIRYAEVRGPVLDIRGTVIEDTGGPAVRVRWEDGAHTWSQRALLTLVNR